MITERQERLLNFLVREYIGSAEPVSSKALRKSANLDCCEATVRNDLQALTEAGYITQPHTSAGRVPTRKAYRYFADKIEAQRQQEQKAFDEFIVRQIRFAHRQMAKEMQMMQELMETLEQDNLFDILNILEKWHKKI